MKPLAAPPGAQFLQPTDAGTERKIREEQADVTNSFRKFCFYFVVALVFVRFSMLHQLLTYKLGVNLYLLYILGLPSIAGFFLTGGIRRLFRSRPPVYWTCFAAFLICSSVFSTWRGGSVALVMVYLRTDFLMLFVVGGVAVGWRECRILLSTLAVSVVMSEITIKMFARLDMNGRTNLEFGTISNSNDYAAHLILVLPFLLWSALSAKNFLMRMISVGGVAYGFYLIVASGSRGAAIALIVSVLTVLFTATPRQRVVGFVLSGIMLVAAIGFVPSEALRRILSFSERSADSSVEALQSSSIRKQLLRDSIHFAIIHPFFGLGPGEFNESEGQSRKLEGQVGLYYEAHNSFMTIASECGAPALIFYIAGIISSVFVLNAVGRRIASDPTASDVRNAIVCIRASIFGYCMAIAFVNFAYFFYLPALAGLIAVLSGCVFEKATLPVAQAPAWPARYSPGFGNGPLRRQQPGLISR